MAIVTDKAGEIIETPQASEVYEKLPEPKRIIPENDKVKKWACCPRLS